MVTVRPTRVVVDLDQIRANVAALVAFVEGALVCPAVKADGYGHGDVPVAHAAVDGGAAWLAVATIEEGIRLREGGIEVPVLLLSEPPVASAKSVIDWRLTPAVYSLPFIDNLEQVASQSLNVHLKVDTGMHRVGTSAPEVVARRIVRSPLLNLQGFWSHLAVADVDDEYTDLQRERFIAACAALEADGIDVEMRHLSNTAGLLRGSDYWFDMVRPGIAAYGLPPIPEATMPAAIQPALRLESAVSHVQRLAAGERPSYGRRKPLLQDATVVTVPIGYADGYDRGLSDGQVLIRGRRYPIAGTITMDQLMVAVGDDEVAIGDEVVLIGAQGEETITATDLAGELGTINYEVLTRLGPRLRRVYQP